MISFARTPHSELVYRQPLGRRLLAAGFAVAMLAFLLAMWPQLLAQSPPMPALLALAGLWLMLIVACLWMALSLRVAFVFGVDAMAARGAWRTRTLAYDHIAGCSVVHEEHAKGGGAVVSGYRLTFEAMRPGIQPLQLFVRDGKPLDAAIVRRLKTVPGLSSRQLKVLELAATGRS